MSQLEETLAYIEECRLKKDGVGKLIVHQLELTARLIDMLDKPKKRPAKSKPQIGILAFLQMCTDKKEDAIPADDPIFKYAEESNIPRNFIGICFNEFVERNKDNNKRQKDWRQHFRNCVRANWYNLWYYDAGECKLTNKGVQAAQKMKGSKN